MALFSTLSIIWLTLAAPEAPPPAPVPVSTVQDIRVVLFISAPKTLQRPVIEQIAIPVGQEVELVPMNEFQTAQKRAHLKRAGSLKAAVALARTLRLSHVVTVSVVQPSRRRRGRGGDQHTFLEVFVGRLRPNREILSVKRYYLPGRKLTASIAQLIVNRIKTQVQIPPKPPKAPGHEVEDGGDDKASADASAGAAAAKRTAEALKHNRKDDRSDLAPLTQDIMAEQEAEEDAQKEKAAVDANRVLHMRASLAMTLVQRNAYLAAGLSGESPPCYCGAGTFYNTFVGAHAALELFFNAGIPGLGAMTDLTAYWPRTDVQTDGQGREVRSFVADFHLALAYRWHSSIGIELTPAAGWGLYDFPLSDGPFPGLSYSYPFFGLDIAYVFGGEAWRLHAGVDYLASLGTGEDAQRLGQKTSGNGVQADGGITWAIGPVEVGLSLAYVKRSVGFTGKTFLFTPQNFDTVSLSDQQMQLLLSVGTRFW